ncbi:MAG: sugar ABC transporter ATP-binding protein [Candidatus Atribacteria bacterium]|nr:sugar ABC transporter ATP-binding protein [Candidatus Atribacteria bacterium]
MVVGRSTKEVTLKMEGIVKSFPGTLAVDHVDFACSRGEIHGLVGENGAGKSTLMKILGGIHQQDKGKLFIHHQEKNFRDYSDARKSGVGIVYQELSLFPDLSVAENIFMGIWPRKGRFIDWDEIKVRGKEILNEINVPLDPEELVEGLPVALKQMVEIAKVLTQNPEIIVFDEPTAALSKDEVSRLFRIIYQLKEKNKTIIFISHRLKEVLDISDIITIMKDGKIVMTQPKEYFNEDKLISAMVGREFSKIFPPKENRVSKEIIFSFDGILEKFKKRVKLSLFKGEVLGIGGLQGQGQIELLQSIFGLGESIEQKIWISDQEIKVRNPSQAAQSGISLVPEDRNGEGVFLILSILQNITAATIDRRTRFNLIDKQKEKEEAKEMRNKLAIKMTGYHQIARSLSGGNLQKIVLAKWLLSNPKVMVMLEPTKGVDVGTKQQIYALVRNLSKEGVAVIVYTSEMIELIGICDRVLVMHQGFLTANLQGKDITEEKIMKASVSNENILVKDQR